MSAVFLSYAIANEREANYVQRVLTEHGITATTGMTIPVGANVSKSVLDEMKSVDAFVFLISKQFVKSQWTQIEVAAATAKFTRGEGKLLIPVLLGRDLDPAVDVPPLLSRFSWLDLREDGVSEKSLAPLVKLLSDLAPQASVAAQLQAEREVLLLRQQMEELRASRVTMELHAVERASLRKASMASVWGVSAALLGGLAAVLAVFVTRGGGAHEGSTGAALVVSIAGNFLALTLTLATLLARGRHWRSAARITKRGPDDGPH